MSCDNCEAPVSGNYCANCGQRQSGRLKAWDILRSLPERLIDRGMWPTFTALTLRPGRVPLDFIKGRRKRYVNPISYYILGATAQLVMLWLNNDYITGAFADSTANGPLFEQLSGAGIEDPRSWVAKRYTLLIQNVYTWLGLLALVFPFALGIRYIARTGYNFAESLVFSLYTIAHLFLITALIQPLTIRMGGALLHGILSQVIYFVYTGIVAYRVFRPARWPIAGTLIALVLADLMFLLSLSIGLAVMFMPGLIGD